MKPITVKLEFKLTDTKGTAIATTRDKSKYLQFTACAATHEIEGDTA